MPKAIHSLSTITLANCSQLNVEDTQIVQKKAFKANDLLNAVILTAAFLFLLGVPPVGNENKHPLYNSSGKIRSAIPIFLEYRKLIIHYAC